MLAPDSETWRTNVLSTFNVLEAASKLGVRKIVLASSVCVYGVTFGQGDVSLSIPELVESYKQDSHAGEPEAGSTYSTQGVSLSFNDLPCRAQHLILNELMRQHSKETAVLMSTLPIPSEGTCLYEAESIQYLSDIEVLCNELPPILMILSNNMTVTVSL